jgi:hypothetical protein
MLKLAIYSTLSAAACLVLMWTPLVGPMGPCGSLGQLACLIAAFVAAVIAAGSWAIFVCMSVIKRLRASGITTVGIGKPHDN